MLHISRILKYIYPIFITIYVTMTLTIDNITYSKITYKHKYFL